MATVFPHPPVSDMTVGIATHDLGATNGQWSLDLKW